VEAVGHPGTLSHPPTVRGCGAGLCENRGMKRARKWSADSKGGERPAGEPDGPLRRRKALRHLDSLALDPEREPSPAAAIAHVRVIGEPGGVPGGPRVVPRGTSERVTQDDDDAGPGEQATAKRLHGHRVQAVPIDQPFADPPGSAAPES
jgi:hypothetical protein